MAAMKAFKEAITGEVVTTQEIKRRAAVCDTCPMRRAVSGTSSRASQTLGIIANKNRVPPSIKNYKCEVCGCALLMLIPAKTPHQDNEEQRKSRPKGCWYFTAGE